MRFWFSDSFPLATSGSRTKIQESMSFGGLRGTAEPSAYTCVLASRGHLMCIRLMLACMLKHFEVP
jgi:hypothetical protein